MDWIQKIRFVVIYWLLFEYWTSLEKQFVFFNDEIISVVNRLCEKLKKKMIRIKTFGYYEYTY